VSLDEPWYDGAIGRVDDHVRRASAAAYLRDLPVNNQQLALDDGLRGIHRHERAVFYEYGSHG